jgi:hypothetical protein
MMLRSISRLATVILLVALGCGCSWRPWGGGRKKKAEAERALAEAKRAPIVLGRVSLVNVEERFALIEASMAQPPPAGTTLRIYSGGSIAVDLRATGVQRRPFLVADLVTGMPAKGDLVEQPVAEAAPAPAATPSPAATPIPAATPPRWRKWLPFFGRRK